MKNILALIYFIVFVVSAHAQSPWYFGSGKAVNLTNAVRYKNGIELLTGGLDPSATAVNADTGSLYLSTNATTYVKQDNGLSTNWLPFGIASTGTVSTINGQSGPSVTLASGTAGTNFVISASANTITFDIPSSSASARGLLTSTDWSTFNGKQAAGNYITALTGDVAASGPGSAAATISNLAVTNAKIANSTIDLTTKVTGTLPVANGGTGRISLALNGVLIGQGSSGFLSIAPSSAGNILYDTGSAWQSVAPAVASIVTGVASSVDSEVALFSGTTGKEIKRATGSGFAKLSSGVLSASSAVNAASELTGIAPVANGGTGANSLTANYALLGNGTSALQAVAPGASGNVLTSNGTTWTSSIPTGGGPGAYTSVTTTYTVLSTDSTLLLSASGGSYTVTLPTAVGVSGKIYSFKKTDTTTNTVTIDGAGAETIDGDLTILMASKGDFFSMVSNGANWEMLADQVAIIVDATNTSASQGANDGNAIIFATESKDTHNAYAGGAFTCPRLGRYRVEGHIKTNTVVAALGNFLEMQATYTTGAIGYVGPRDVAENTSTRAFSGSIVAEFDCAKSGIIETSFSESLPAVNLSNISSYNHLVIRRVK